MSAPQGFKSVPGAAQRLGTTCHLETLIDWPARGVNSAPLGHSMLNESGVSEAGRYLRSGCGTRRCYGCHVLWPPRARVPPCFVQLYYYKVNTCKPWTMTTGTSQMRKVVTQCATCQLRSSILPASPMPQPGQVLAYPIVYSKWVPVLIASPFFFHSARVGPLSQAPSRHFLHVWRQWCLLLRRGLGRPMRHGSCAAHFTLLLNRQSLGP